MADTRYKAMLLFGPPGVGKGTQGRILGMIPGLHHLATGDMFRGLDKHSQIGRRVAQYSARGELVPDDLTIELWQSHLVRQVDKGVYDPASDLLLLDGIPRSREQAVAMDAYIDVLRIVHLRAPSTDTLIHRMRRRALQEGRHDDADENVIRRRFEVYEQETAPVLGHYPDDVIGIVNPLGMPIEVLDRILEVVVPACRGVFENPLER